VSKDTAPRTLQAQDKLEVRGFHTQNIAAKLGFSRDREDFAILPKQRQVRGIEVDAQTRCVHYHSAVDIVAIKIKCCGVYYACKDCHTEVAGHAIAVWPRGEWDARAVLCGACGREMTIREYFDCESRCPGCGAGFNPGCRKHWHFYFEAGESEP
jgi:uncharacterized CHY-type Zn-finger protein